MSSNWYRLDTAGLIFPAIMNHRWSNVFRLSATLKEEVDPAVLQQAVNDLQPRFPALYVSLHRGVFWNYLQQISGHIEVQNDYACPLTFMSVRELKKGCLRVFYYRQRIAVEFFHSITDGSGGKIYLCSLIAQYLKRRYGISFSYDDTVLNPADTPSEAELEDSFYKNGCSVAADRKEEKTYHLQGDLLDDDFNVLISGTMETGQLIDTAHRYHCKVTSFLCAVMAQSIMELQDEKVRKKYQRPVKITVPVNLRKLYGSKTLRNFVLTVNVGIDPRKGDYTFQELCLLFEHQIAFLATRQNMAAAISANTDVQQLAAIKMAPLFIKHMVMSLVYDSSAEIGGSINISNLGNVVMDPVFNDYIEKIEFIIGVQKSYHNNCAVSSFNNVTCINMIRTIRQSSLEQKFFSKLVELGISVEIDSNRR